MSKKPNGKQPRESLCWSCSRAYALPDPLGCAFHRIGHDHVFDSAEFAQRVVTTRGEKIYTKVIIVQKCQNYELSDKYTRDKRAAYFKRNPQKEVEAI